MFLSSSSIRREGIPAPSTWYVRTSLTTELSRLRKIESEKYYAPIEVQKHSLFHMILFSIYTPFSKCDAPLDSTWGSDLILELLLFDRMALLLDIW